MCRAKRILAVDDDPKIRMLLKAVLEDEGFEVDVAADGAAALRRLNPEPCLILLDLRMPVLDGTGFIRAYRQRARPIADIIVTTAEPRGKQEAAALAVDYLRKPFDLDVLLDRVEQHVQTHAA